MRPTVRLSYGPVEVITHAPEGRDAWSAEQARRWLDDQFVAYECEPLRALGKVLAKDKVIALADAIGSRGFEADEALRGDYASAVTSLLARPQVHVDVGGRAVSY